MVDIPDDPDLELNRLSDLLSEIGNADISFDVRMSAYEWCDHYTQEIAEILKKIHDRGIEIDLVRKDEITTTLEELILNSIFACDEGKDLAIHVRLYLGQIGIVLHIADEGEGFDHAVTLERSRLNPGKLTRDKVLYNRDEPSYPGGTGMFCLLNFSQNFQFNPKGNELVVLLMYNP